MRKSVVLSPVSPSSPQTRSDTYQRNCSKQTKFPNDTIQHSLTAELQQFTQLITTSLLNTSLRNTIYYFYIHRLDAPHKEHLGGKEETVSTILHALQLPLKVHRKVLHTLKNSMRCIHKGEPFDRKPRITPCRGPERRR